uniref:Uncharacterized protein n=1 Tax=Anguilla anguilla TaxID=7936 RepID=A0A0E9XE76_ANGAN
MKGNAGQKLTSQEALFSGRYMIVLTDMFVTCSAGTNFGSTAFINGV